MLFPQFDQIAPIYFKNINIIKTVVEIFGEHISLEKMAEELNTIPYEIICLLSSRVTRRYIWHNKIQDEENSRLEKSILTKERN